MKRLNSDPHRPTDDIPLKFGKEQRMGIAKDWKMQKATCINQRRERNAQLSEILALCNSNQTRAVLSKYTVEQIPKTLRRGTLVNNLKETVLNIEKIMYALSPKEPRGILSNGIGKRYSAFHRSLVMLY